MIELLVAMLVLSTGLLGMGRLTVGVIQGNLDSRNHSVATLLTQDRIEGLKGPGGGNANPATEPYGTIPGFLQYKRVMDVQRDTPQVGLSTVTVTVYWDGDARSAALKTIVSR